MKKLSTIILASAMAMVSSHALANPMHVQYEGTTTLATEITESKESAYEGAALKLDELKNSSSTELKQELGVSGFDLVKNSITLNDGAYIIAQEYMNEKGELRYMGLINVSYQYLKAENNS